MSARKKDPLRPLTEAERLHLEQLSRSRTAPAAEVRHAQMLLLVAQGKAYTQAARSSGYRNGDTAAALVARFNKEGLPAVTPRHGGGAKRVYGAAAEERILREYARTPDREVDGTAHWTLSTLQRTLRWAPDGLPQVSTFTLWQVLHKAAQSPQRERTWCETGTVVRKRKEGPVLVTDPDTDAKRG
jgi:hypothetical protein